MYKYIINEEQEGLRLDKALSLFFKDKSRTYLAKLINEGLCFVNGKTAKSSLKLEVGDEVEIDIPEVKELDVSKEDIPLDIIYEDDDVLVINKPQGLVVHPAPGHHEHTLVNAVLGHCDNLSGINGVKRPGIVHRIDKDTSGLLLIAKNDRSHEGLAKQLKDHSMHREYIALVKGVIKESQGEIDLPIGRSRSDRKKMGVDPVNGKEAKTYFKVLKRYDNHTLANPSKIIISEGLFTLTEKIKDAFMNLMIEMQEQISPRQVSRTIGEPSSASISTTDANNNNNNPNNNTQVEGQNTNGNNPNPTN